MDPHERELFRERMRLDPLLRYEVRLDESLERLLADPDVMDLRNKIVSASMRKGRGIDLMDLLLIAASVICAIMIGGLYYLSGTNDVNPGGDQGNHKGALCIKSPDSPDISKADDPAPPRPAGDSPSGDVALREGGPSGSFITLPEFELLVGSPVRSGLFRLESPLPDRTMVRGANVNFSWAAPENDEPLVLLVLDNAGSPLFISGLPPTGSYILETGRLVPGLYYWKILSGSDLLILGKLMVLDSLKHR